ncbi:RHS repeat protein [Nonomuraea sp. FMUSA5-5]|uniref:RHS repeat protein n=1 Tax=Nonomuraea composti TaxID=2720023 RepID=A0ABX1BN25_9ACTN|nr:RHS repeat-associated core domain-containing protein [Nonomuraea sp. FMUSA5-5]NJP98432.1 RHS repeat protein [Nonomuraea sp. FMUSA5-5]
MPGGWETLGLAGDPAPGDPVQVRALAARLLEQAKLAEDNTARLNGVLGNTSALNMRGDYAIKYAEALQTLPAELAKLGRAYRGAGDALNTYAGSLEQAKTQAGTALRQGQAAEQQYQGALREVRAQLPASAVTGSLAEVEAAVGAAAPAVQAAVRPAVTRARDAEADRGRARRIAEEAARLRGEAESRAAGEIEQALQGSGIQNKSWLEKAWDTVSTPFRSWDDFVNLARNVAMVAGIVVLIIGTGGLAGAILLGATVALGAIVFADSLNKYRQGKAGLGQVVLDGIGMIPGGRQVGLLAMGGKAVAALGGLAAGVRAGGGCAVGLFRAGIPAGPSAFTGAGLRAAVAGRAGRVSTAAGTAWQKTRQFFSKDPVHFPTGTVLLPQTDVELPGVLPLVLERTHLSGYRVGRWLGPGWASTLDQRLEVDEQGVCLALATGGILSFPHPGQGEAVLPEEGPRLLLAREGDDGYQVTDPATGHTLHFAAAEDRDAGEAASGVAQVLPLSAITDRNANRIDLHYTADGVLAEVAHAGGYHLDIETHAGLIVSIRLREAGQTLIAYRYDEHRNLTEVINSSGLPLRFSYDEHGRMTRWADRIGTWYAYTYDDQGRCVHGTGCDGVYGVEIEYRGGVTVARDSLGHATTYHYNDLLQVVREIDPLGHEVRYEWDRYGHLLARTDPLGRTARYAYDEHGLLTSIVRPDGAVSRLVRDQAGRPVTVVGFDGRVHVRDHDQHGNLLGEPEGARYAYHAHGGPAGFTNALGHTWSVDCDPAGLPVAVTDPTGAVTRYERDAFGRITAVTDPLGSTARYAWTVEGRLAARTSPSGATEHWQYDAEGNLIEHTDALGQITRTEIGPFDMPAARITPDGARLEFGYDTELRLTRVSNPDGLVWCYDYDATGALAAETDFNDRRLTYRRDPAGQLVERVNGVGESTHFVHDLLGRIIEQHSGDRVTTFEHDALGRLIRAVNPDADLRLDRDEDGRVLAETCNGATVTNVYDRLGRRVLRRTPSGAQSRWEYDHRDLPQALHTGGHTITFTHDPAGREIARRIGSDLTLTSEWGPDSRLCSHTWSAGPSGKRVRQRRGYAYRADGHVSAIDDLLSGRRRFDLDPVGRVTAVHGNGFDERYAYDPAGQITRATWATPSPGQGERAYTGTLIRTAGQDRYHYDAQGRVIARQGPSKQLWRYTWDADDRLTEVRTPDGQIWHYRYDALGRRIAKERADGTGRVDFVWDGRLLAEQTTTGRTTTWDFEPGTHRPLTQTERLPQEHIDQAFYAIATDLLGTPTELITADGDVAWRTRHTLWGSDLGTLSTGADCPLRFAGQYADPESGLHYNVFRHYDPATAHYTSGDPLGLAPGPNPYAFVHNPITAADPLGLTAYGGPGGKHVLDEQPATSFTGWRYTERILEQDTVLYRAGHHDLPLGQYFSVEKPQGVLQARIDKALPPKWDDGTECVLDTGFAVKIPKGVTVYEGEIANQGSLYMGGTGQIFIPKPWTIPGVEVLDSWPLH